MQTKWTLPLLGLALSAVAAPAVAQESNFGPKDAKEVYYWVSNKANLPLFVKYDYVGMKKIADELQVQVRVAGPTDFDLPGFIAAVDQVCAQKPAGVSVVGGWDPSLTESVRKCIAEGVPTVVDDGDLPDSGRLAYIGTDWTAIGQAQAKKMMEALPNGGKIAMTSIINANNMREGVAGFTAYIKAHGGDKYQLVANEDDNGDASKAAQVTSALLAAHPDLAGIAGFELGIGRRHRHRVARGRQETRPDPRHGDGTDARLLQDGEGRVDRRHHRAEPGALHLLRGPDALRLSSQWLEDGGSRLAGRRQNDPEQCRHWRAGGVQGQRRQSSDGDERQIAALIFRGAGRRWLHRNRGVRHGPEADHQHPVPRSRCL